MKVKNFKNSLYYKIYTKRHTNMEKPADLIDKQLQTTSFGIKIAGPGQYYFYFGRNPMSLYAVGTKEGDFLFSQTIEYLEHTIFYAEKVDAVMLKAYASMFYISMTKNEFRLTKGISKEEYEVLAKTLQENPEYLETLQFEDKFMDMIEGAKLKDIAISLDYKQTKSFKSYPAIMKTFVENNADMLLENMEFGIFMPPADDVSYVLKNAKLSRNPIIKNLTVTALTEAVAHQLENPELTEEEKINYKAFAGLLKSCSDTDLSYATKRMDGNELKANPPEKDRIK